MEERLPWIRSKLRPSLGIDEILLRIGWNILPSGSSKIRARSKYSSVLESIPSWIQSEPYPRKSQLRSGGCFNLIRKKFRLQSRGIYQPSNAMLSSPLEASSRGELWRRLESHPKECINFVRRNFSSKEVPIPIWRNIQPHLKKSRIPSERIYQPCPKEFLIQSERVSQSYPRKPWFQSGGIFESCSTGARPNSNSEEYINLDREVLSPIRRAISPLFKEDLRSNR